MNVLRDHYDSVKSHELMPVWLYATAIVGLPTHKSSREIPQGIKIVAKNSASKKRWITLVQCLRLCPRYWSCLPQASHLPNFGLPRWSLRRWLAAATCSFRGQTRPSASEVSPLPSTVSEVLVLSTSSKSPAQFQTCHVGHSGIGWPQRPVSQANTSIGQRSFSVVAPVIWNALPPDLRSPHNSRQQFQSKLKTHCYRQAYNTAWLL